MRLILPLLLALGLLSTTASAQQIRPGQTVQMIKSGSGPADHATVAVNQYGDVVVAYHTRVSTGQRLVEAQVLRNLGAGTWASNRAHHLILGDPALSLYGPQRDNCTKPDVVALEDGSFVVAWPRTDLQDKQVGQLEVARVEIRNAGGLLLSQPALQVPGAGFGYVVDPLVVCGDAGVMPSLAAVHNGDAVVVYATQDSRTVAGNGDIWRDYSLRALSMDWSVGPTNPGFSTGPFNLVSGIPMDSDFWNIFTGGMVLPDVVTDDSGHLVVAWEQYSLQGRTGYAGNDRGEVGVARFAGFSASSPLLPMDLEYFSSFFSELQQRRPMLSASRTDAANVVLLAWADLNRLPFASDDTRFKEILYATTAGQSSSSDRFWSNDPGLDEGHPSPSQTGLHQRCFATRAYPSSRVILGSVHASQSTFPVPSPITYPERVAVEVFETATPAGIPLSILFIAYEGSNYNDPDLYHTYLGVFKL